MNITLSRLNDNFYLEAKNENGLSIKMDSGDNLAPSPMEVLLMSVAGCSSIDVISILKKQRQNIDNYNVKINADRIQVEEAKPFKTINVTFILDGNIEPSKAIRAVELSFTKYCSVSKTLEPTVTITHQIILNGITIN